MTDPLEYGLRHLRIPDWEEVAASIQRSRHRDPPEPDEPDQLLSEAQEIQEAIELGLRRQP